METGLSSVVGRIDIGSLVQSFANKEEQIFFVVTIDAFHLGKGLFELQNEDMLMNSWENTPYCYIPL